MGITSAYRQDPSLWNACATGAKAWDSNPERAPSGSCLAGCRRGACRWDFPGALTFGGGLHLLYSDDRGLTWHMGALALPENGEKLDAL